MIEQAVKGRYLSTLAYYIHLEVPPSLRIDGIKQGPFHRPKDLVPVIPLLGSLERAVLYDPCKIAEMEIISDAFTLLASWQWLGSGIVFSKRLTKLSILEDLGTPYYNVLNETCDEVCPGCGQVYEHLMFMAGRGGFPCPKCPPQPGLKAYVSP